MARLRHAIRALRNNPGFAAVTALSLGLGVGANTAIFSLIDAVMLKTLPVSRPEELLQVTAGGDRGYFSNPVWEQIRDRQDAFSGIFAYCRWAFNLPSGGEARNVNGAYASGRFFDTLGVPAALGRTFTPADDRRGCAGTAVLTYGYWQREYGGRAHILGRTISIDNHLFEIVGVAARGFSGTEVGASLDVMVPLCAEKILHAIARCSTQIRRAAGCASSAGQSGPRRRAGPPAGCRLLHPRYFAPPFCRSGRHRTGRNGCVHRWLRRPRHTACPLCARNTARRCWS